MLNELLIVTGYLLIVINDRIPLKEGDHAAFYK